MKSSPSRSAAAWDRGFRRGLSEPAGRAGLPLRAGDRPEGASHRPPLVRGQWRAPLRQKLRSDKVSLRARHRRLRLRRPARARSRADPRPRHRPLHRQRRCAAAARPHPGVGKTHLAKAQADGRLEERLTHFAKPKLLIVDELGYLPLEPDAAPLFFQLVSRRYERGSTLITSNPAVGEWGAVFSEPVQRKDVSPDRSGRALLRTAPATSSSSPPPPRPSGGLPSWRRTRREKPGPGPSDTDVTRAKCSPSSTKSASKGRSSASGRRARSQSAYILGAVCPGRGVAAGLVMRFADTPAMNSPPRRDRPRRPTGRLCRARPRWRGGGGLVLPANISLVLPPPYSPELDPGRERLAIPARKLARDQRLRPLRRHRRRLLRRLEPLRSPTRGLHIDRIQGVREDPSARPLGIRRRPCKTCVQERGCDSRGLGAAWGSPAATVGGGPPRPGSSRPVRRPSGRSTRT